MQSRRGHCYLSGEDLPVRRNTLHAAADLGLTTVMLLFRHVLAEFYILDGGHQACRQHGVFLRSCVELVKLRVIATFPLVPLVIFVASSWEQLFLLAIVRTPPTYLLAILAAGNGSASSSPEHTPFRYSSILRSSSVFFGKASYRGRASLDFLDICAWAGDMSGGRGMWGCLCSVTW
jgi:hypothetical protein